MDASAVGKAIINGLINGWEKVWRGWLFKSRHITSQTPTPYHQCLGFKAERQLRCAATQTQRQQLLLFAVGQRPDLREHHAPDEIWQYSTDKFGTVVAFLPITLALKRL